MAPKTAWATQVDAEEADGAEALPALPAAFAASTAFPSLGDAVKVQETKAEKKKRAQKMSLADLHSSVGGAASGKFSVGAARQRAAVKEEDDVLKFLPKGPRARDESEEAAGPTLGGAFKDYGGQRGGFGDHDDRDRRDGDRGGFGQRRGGFGDRDRDDSSQTSNDGPSRADEADSWGGRSKFVPSDRSSGGGGGFGDRDGRRGGFDDREPSRDDADTGPSRADTSADWGRDRRPQEPPPARGGFSERSGVYGDRDRDSYGSSRRDDFGSGGRADTTSSWGRPGGGSSSMGAGSAAPSSGSRPRLQLAPRTKPVEPIAVLATEKPPAAESKAPSSDAGTGTSDTSEQAALAPPKPRSNPFGAARPREDVLKEQGRDWRKEELELAHKSVQRDETAEETALQERIAALQQLASEGKGDEPAPADLGDVPAEGDESATANGGETAADEEVKEAPPREGAKQRTVSELLDDLDAQRLMLTTSLDDKWRYARSAAPAGRSRFD